MYTVEQVGKFLGISKDTLKFYEEKNLINTKQDEENGYIKYNIIGWIYNCYDNLSFRGA